MSHVTELADAEAERVEAELGPDDPEPTPEPEPEPTPEPEPEAPPQALAPDVKDRAERAIAAQRRKLAGILGDAAVAHECFVCTALGFLPGLPEPGTRLVVIPDGEGVTFDVEEAPPEIPLKEDTTKVECEVCDGYGELLAPTKVPTARVVFCTTCNGQGWVVAQVAQFAPNVAGTLGTAPAGQENVAKVTMPDDAWGRPFGHEFYGRAPETIPVDPARLA